MRKRFLVSFVAVAALAAIASPAFGQGRSTHKALRGSVHAVSARSFGASVAAAPLANWTNLASMNTAVGETGGGAFAQKKLYVPGGFNSAGAVTDQMQIYNAVSNTWSTDPDHLSDLSGLPGVADAAICADANGKIHVVDGTLDGAFIYASHFLFDPTAPAGSKWSALAFPNTPVDGNYYSQDPGCTFIQGKMYLYGGYGLTDAQGSAQVERLTWVYDPLTDTWSDTGKLMVQARFWHGYTNTKNRIFAAGGTDNVTTFAPIAKVETFTVNAGWKAMADLPAARLAPGMGLLGSTVTVFGGGNSSFAPLASTVGCTGGTQCINGPWTDLNKNLNTARWFTAYGSSGNKLFNAGGFNSAGATLSSAESTS